MKNNKSRVLILSGDLIKHKFIAINLLKKFSNAKIIIEKYPKKIFENYTKEKSIIIRNHFRDVHNYEKKNFYKYCKKNQTLLNQRLFFSVNRGQINSLRVIKQIKKFNPTLIIVNATSILKKNLLKILKTNAVNIHQGLLPYYRGTGTNVWTFYNQELQYTGVTIHFINDKIDAGRIILQAQSEFKENDNTHSIGCRNTKLSVKLVKKAVDYLFKNPNYKGERIKTKKSKIFFKKDFNENTVIKINRLIKNGLVKNYIRNKKKIKLVDKYKLNA